MDTLNYCPILKTNITVTNMESTVDYLIENLDSIRGEYICVSNVHTTISAFRDEKYRAVQNGALMALPDGKPLSIVQRKRGYLNAGRVPGPDLMPKIFSISKKYGFKHYFYGGTPETLEKLRDKLKERYPELDIVGMYSPPFRPLTEEEDKAAVKAINDAKPDFIWVALGAPKQENWMAAHKGQVNGVMLGVGAAFDFEAGTVKRAPKWMQELCLEWLYRLLQDPLRLIPRYFSTNGSFLFNVYKENRAIRKNERAIDRKHRASDKGKKRIAMIGHKRIPSREGGVEVVVEELSTRLVKKGYAVDAYNRDGYHVSGRDYSTNGRRGYYEGVKILTIPTFQNGKLNAIVYSFNATIRALFSKYDVIHVHAEGPCFFLWILKLKQCVLRKRPKIIATIHGLDWQRAKWGNFASRVLKSGEKQAVKHADEIIVLSKNVQEYFKETYGRDTHYIPNGVAKSEGIGARMIADKYGLKDNGYILFLARMVPEKGLHYLIEAYKNIETDLKLVIAGGSSHSFEYMDEIDRMIGDNPNIIRTNFVQGQILAELYSNAYVYVLPSDIEGMALTLLEAMSYGSCVLVSDIAENMEVIGDAGVTFKQGDVKSLETELKRLIDHPEVVNDYRSKSAEYITTKFDWDKVTELTEELYENTNS